MRRWILSVLIASLAAVGFSLTHSASAQISVPNSFVAGTVASADKVNQNFITLGQQAVNRAGGVLTGNLAANPGVTIDGIDISASLCTTCSAVFSSVADSTGTLATVRGGGIGVASQQALDFIFASSGTQFGRLAKGTALQAVRLNSSATAYEFYTPATGSKETVNGRLTLESGVPVSTTDQSAKAVLYFTPYRGNDIGLYSGTSWSVLTFSELSLSLSGYIAGRPYDIFAWDNGGAVALESTAWTNSSTRATALTLQDGILVRSGDATRRYLGTIGINSTGGQSDDTAEARLVYNHYHQRWRVLARHDATASWSTTTSWAQARGQSANRVQVMVGWLGDCTIRLKAIHYGILAFTPSPGNISFATAIGENSTTTPVTPSVYASALTSSSGSVDLSGGYSAHFEIDRTPPIGLNAYNWLEYGNGAVTVYGYADSIHKVRSGLTGNVWQ